MIPVTQPTRPQPERTGQWSVLLLLEESYSGPNRRWRFVRLLFLLIGIAALVIVHGFILRNIFTAE